MPTYQYACTECGERLEMVQKFSDDPLTVCPACSGRLRKVFSPVGIVFKGSGFYRTDSRAGSNGAAGGAEAAKGSDGAEAGTKDTGSGAGAESKSGSSGSTKPAASSSSSGSSSSGSGASAGEKVA